MAEAKWHLQVGGRHVSLPGLHWCRGGGGRGAVWHLSLPCSPRVQAGSTVCQWGRSHDLLAGMTHGLLLPLSD